MIDIGLKTLAIKMDDFGMCVIGGKAGRPIRMDMQSKIAVTRKYGGRLKGGQF